MGKDFYATLGVPRDASASQIKKAYHMLALKFHPDKNPDNREEAEKKFKEVSEAYDCLGDEKKKSVYDRFGEEGLRNGGGEGGFPGGAGGFPGAGGAQFQQFSTQDASRVFQQFFGSADPFSGGGMNFGSAEGGPGLHSFFSGFGGGGNGGGGGMGGMPGMGGMGGMPGMGGMGGMPGMGGMGGMPFFNMGGMGGGMPDGMDGGSSPGRGGSKPPAVEFTYAVSLEEILKGTTKKFSVTRKTRQGADDKKTFEVEVKPGYKAGTKVSYENDGGYIGGYMANADLIFIMEEKPHPSFMRDGADLKHKATIPLRDALLGTSVKVPKLGGGTIDLPLPGITTSGRKLRVSGEGLPDRKKGGQRGDLTVEVLVKMPARLSDKQRDLVAQAFPPGAM